MDAETLIAKYYSDFPKAQHILLEHSRAVRNKAFDIARNVSGSVDLTDLHHAALLHDIGIVKIHAPGIGCFGSLPYLAHGYMGREILEKEGLKTIAAVCERHVGVGITKKEIGEKQLPLPSRDMLPESMIEKIITIADKFFSKNPKKLATELPVDRILKKLSKNGSDKPERFLELCRELNFDPAN